MDLCVECGKPIQTEDNLLYCEDCEDKILSDPAFWYDYCRFCGIPISMEGAAELVATGHTNKMEAC